MKFDVHNSQVDAGRSRPARALWIEINKRITWNGHNRVEAREGLVD